MVRFLLFFLLLSCCAGNGICQETGAIKKNIEKREKAYLLLQKAKRTNKKADFVLSYTNIGKCYIEEGNYELALSFLMKAKSFNEEDSAYITPYYTAFGVLFSKIGAYSGAIEYEKKIFNQPGSKLSRFYSASSIGWLYLKLNMIDSASKYYSKQYDIAAGMNDYIAVSSVLNNQGLVFYDNHQYVKALSLFRQSIEILEQNKGKSSPNFQSEIEDFRYNVVENMGRCYFFLGFYLKAIENLESANSHIHQTEVNNNKVCLLKSYLAISDMVKAKELIRFLEKSCDLSSVESKSLLEEIRLSFFLHNNDMPQVKKCVEKLEVLHKELEANKLIKTNRMSLMISRYLISEARFNIQREKSMKKIALKRLSIEKQQNVFFIFTLIGIGILFSFSMVLYIQFSKNKKRKFSLENERLLLNNERQNLKIKAQEMYLTEYALDFTKNKEHELTVIKYLNEIAGHQAEVIPGEIKSLIAELKQKQNIDKRAEGLAIDAQNVLADFRYALQERHPDLKKSDIQLCYLLRLELSNKKIAMIRNVSPNSVKIFKNRLKNKLQLSPEVSLTEYLNSI